jgi:hypothetical protein
MNDARILGEGPLMAEYDDAFKLVMGEARKISGISEIERTEFYEPLKAKICELLHDGRTDVGTVADEALSWLRQNAQINQSLNRITGKD